MHRRILVVAALALGGCSLSLDTKDLDPLRDVEPFCQTLFGEIISDMAACTGWTQQLVDWEYDRAVSLCAGFAWSSSQGRLGYDRSLAQSCLSVLRGASCTANLAEEVEDCKLAIPGRRPDGADCYDDAECADREARCTYPLPQCPGRCSAPGHPGDPCGPGYRPCSIGSYCGPASTCLEALAENAACSTTPAACGDPGQAECTASGTCIRYALEGQPCGTARPCAKPTDDDRAAPLFCDTLNSPLPVCRRYGTVPLGGLCQSQECDPSGWCYVGGAPPGTCIARLGAGLACLGDSMCAPPLACIGDSLVAGTYTFGVCNPRDAIGAPCNPLSVDCPYGATCIEKAGAFTCQPWPSQLDAPCGLNPGDQFCYAGRCDPAGAPVCRPWRAPGDACAVDGDCGPFGGMGAPLCVTTASGSRQCVPGCMLR